MSCARCELRPVVATPTLAVGYLPGGLPPAPEDSLFPLPSPWTGPMTTPPDGFGPPRICSYCGVVYYPAGRAPRTEKTGVMKTEEQKVP